MKNSSEIEYELTYLVNSLPENYKQAKYKNLIDVYIPSDISIHPRLRARKFGAHYELTKKLPLESGDASAHSETTIPLTEEEFNELSSKSLRTIKKTRYYIDIDGHSAELDVFTGDLSGLVLLDFEFTSKSELEMFIPPAICSVDVTQEEFIAGGLLAGKTYQDISSKLDSFNYEKITS